MSAFLSDPSDGTVVEQVPCTPPSFDEWVAAVESRLDEERRRLDAQFAGIAEPTPAERLRYERIGLELERLRGQHVARDLYERATDPRTIECFRLTYLSDGLHIKGYVFGLKPQPPRRRPVLFFNRGGNRDFSPVRYPGSVLQLWPFIEAGFVVVGSQYRGGPGSEGSDEFGGRDVNDVLSLIPLARSLGYADMSNVFMFGPSRGGMMAHLAVKAEMPVNAVAVQAAPTDLARLAERRPEMAARVFRELFPDFKTRAADHYQARSAVLWPESLTAPLLMFHGTADWRTPPEDSLDLARLLQGLGRPYGLVVYPGADHMLSDHRAERDSAILSWFRRFMR